MNDRIHGGQGLGAATCSAVFLKRLLGKEADSNQLFAETWNSIANNHLSIIMNRWVLHPLIEKVTQTDTLLQLATLPVFVIQEDKSPPVGSMRAQML